MTGRLRVGAQVAAVGVVAALLALLVWKVAKGTDNGVTSSLAMGGLPTAPAFSLERLDQVGELDLDSLRGKAVVLNFWASWCGPCRDELPVLESAWQRWRDDGVLFVGIDIRDFRADARHFLKRFGVTYPNVYDGKGSTVGRYGTTGVPETYFVDGRGRVVYRIAGPVEEADELDEGVERAVDTRDANLTAARANPVVDLLRGAAALLACQVVDDRASGAAATETRGPEPREGALGPIAHRPRR